MSIRVMTQVWEHSRAKGSLLVLMLAIADFAGDDGYGAHPSVGTLAAKIRMSERRTREMLRVLEEMGEVETAPGAGPHGANAYRVMVAGGQRTPAEGGNVRPLTPAEFAGVEGQCSPPAMFAPGEPSPQRGAAGRRGGGRALAEGGAAHRPRSVRDPSDDPSDDPSAAAAARETPAAPAPWEELEGERRDVFSTIVLRCGERRAYGSPDALDDWAYICGAWPPDALWAAMRMCQEQGVRPWPGELRRRLPALEPEDGTAAFEGWGPPASTDDLVAAIRDRRLHEAWRREMERLEAEEGPFDALTPEEQRARQGRARARVEAEDAARFGAAEEVAS